MTVQDCLELEGKNLIFKDFIDIHDMDSSLRNHFSIGKSYTIIEVFSYKNFVNKDNPLKDIRFKIRGDNNEIWIFGLERDSKYALYKYFMSQSDLRKAKLTRLNGGYQRW